jgi:hypothetical protein
MQRILLSSIPHPKTQRPGAAFICNQGLSVPHVSVVSAAKPRQNAILSWIRVELSRSLSHDTSDFSMLDTLRKLD